MRWNLENIRFLHPPYDFVGTFSNEHMQKRHRAMQEKKLEEINTNLESATTPVEAMNILEPSEYITFVKNNREHFEKDGSLEKTVLRLYYRKNSPFAPAGIHEEWVALFALCDRGNLMDLGKPFPQEGTTAYRGSLTGTEHGLSWTTDVKEAKWILNRWEDKEMGGGTVYSAHISYSDILIYFVDEKRQEILLKPERLRDIEPRIITSVS